jgi:hypothetical protein
MQTSNGHVPLSGPSSDPVLYGVATALSQMFPPVEHPSGYDEGDGHDEDPQWRKDRGTE